MKVNTTSVIVGIAGKPFMDENNIALSYRAVMHSALNQSRQGEFIGAELSSKRYAIIHKLYSSSQVDLTDTERQIIREAMEGSTYTPEVRGLVGDFLDSDKGKA